MPDKAAVGEVIKEPRLGVYVCHCGINLAFRVDVEKVVEEVSKLPGVAIARTYSYMCSDPGQAQIREDVEEHGLTGVVVAACSPRMHEPTFRAAVSDAGINAYQFDMANIREQCSWIHEDESEATEKAIDLVRAAVARASHLTPLQEREVPVTRSALVIGGGIAGIQAALDIGNAGFKTYLVERDPSIGGRMAQLDKTFPTLDCSACILTPRMVEVGRHPNIELLAYSEVEEISGYVGNFTAKVRRKATCVDWVACNACTDCVDACPVELRNEFEAGLVPRKAIYRPFPQAVPNKFTIEKRGVPPCREACPAGVNAQGYVTLIREGKYAEALELEREANPFPSVCGRVCTHPCEESCKRSEIEEPLAIALLKRFIADRELEAERVLPEPAQEREERVAVVGSGPAGLSAAWELARRGYAVTVFEALDVVGGMLRVGIPDFRLPKDALQADIDYIEALGVEIVTGKALGQDFTVRSLLDDGFRAIFVAVGAHRERRLEVPGEDLGGVRSCLGLLKEVNLGGKPGLGEKVAVIGGGNAAIDAARTALRLGSGEVTIVYRRSRDEMPANDEEIEAAQAEGVRIMFLAVPVEILGEGGKVRAVRCIRTELGPPDSSGRRRPVPIPDSELDIEIDAIIPAVSQEPDLSFVDEATPLEASRWSTVEADPDTLETSIPGVFSGGDAVRGAATVIEAVADGKRAAKSIDRYVKGEDLTAGRDVTGKPVEDFGDLSTVVRKRRQRAPELDARRRSRSFDEVVSGFSEEQARDEAARCLECGGCCECRQCEAVCEPDAIRHGMKDEILELEVGTIIVATGFDEFDPRLKPELAYERYDSVITGLEMERLCSASGPTTGEIEIGGRKPKDIVFIQCVGSRDQTVGNEYCSRVCCMFTAKQAHLVREKIPDANITIFYTDVRAFGKGFEEFYDRVRKENVVYRRGSVSEIYRKNGKLIVRGDDTLLGEPLDVEADLVVLAAGLVPRPETDEVASLLRLSRSPDKFLMEAHPKLRPVDTASDGVYLAGCCQGPKDIPDVVAQAKGAAASALGPLSMGRVLVDPLSCVINEDLCAGCRICMSVCPYGALSHDEEKGVSAVTDVLCKGCGTCAAACPAGAISMNHFTSEQMLAQVVALIGAQDGQR